MRERKLGLGITIAAAIVLAAGVSVGLLVLDPRSTASDALRTGGLAGGAVVALYGLWLNDRRRRVTEERQEVERQRAHRESDSVADGNFARAIELLGHEADQVRVGALHALAGLARSRPDYTQTVLDVLCAYLRSPFEHPRYDDSPVDWSKQARDAAERMLVTRLTAQRLIIGLLPDAGEPEGSAYDLDLTGATLEYFHVSRRRIGTLIMRYAHLFSSTTFTRCEFTGPAWFTDMTTGSARLAGRFRCRDSVFRERAWFGGVHFEDLAQFDRTQFLGPARFANTTFDGETSFAGARFEQEANFSGCVLPEGADLTSTTWHGTVDTAGASPLLEKAVTAQQRGRPGDHR